MKSTKYQEALCYLSGRDRLVSNCQCDYCDLLDDASIANPKNDAILSVSPFAPSWEVPELNLIQILDLFEFENLLNE